jgi:predicted dehydrogenase
MTGEEPALSESKGVLQRNAAYGLFTKPSILSESSGGAMLNIGVIGYGYWGPNIVRNFSAVDGAKVLYICDPGEDARKRAKKTNPQIEVIGDYRELVRSPQVDMVAVVTPVSTHFQIAKEALENGKHIFVEKPFTASVAQAEELISLAEKKNLKVMVDHTFIFTGAVQKMKELITEETLGELYYYDSIRVNLGLFQKDINVVWDLAPHDFSIMDYLIKQRPVAVSSCGKAHVNGKEDIAFITAYFNNNLIAHFNVNWLSPVKVRMTLVGGEKRMVVWNDSAADEKLRVYDKGIEVKNKESIYDLLVSYRSGDMWSPKVDQTEALKREAEYFIECINNDIRPINDGHAGLRIVEMLEGCDNSMRKNGRMIYI